MGNIVKNNIFSIETLILLDAPNLMDLDLSTPSPTLGDNQITTIRSIRKCNVALDHLFLAGNPIADFSSLS